MYTFYNIYKMGMINEIKKKMFFMLVAFVLINEYKNVK